MAPIELSKRDFLKAASLTALAYGWNSLNPAPVFAAAVRKVSEDPDPTWDRIRDQFPLSRGRVYFNNGTLGPSPQSVIDAVSICTPNSSHHPITLAAAKAGKHVLCEKPVSLDLAQTHEMIDACATSGVIFQVGHHMRSWDAAVEAKALIDAGGIGEVAYVRLRQAHDWGGALFVRGAFGSKAKSGGGTLLDNGCHLFDLARYFAGFVDES